MSALNVPPRLERAFGHHALPFAEQVGQDALIGDRDRRSCRRSPRNGPQIVAALEAAGLHQPAEPDAGAGRDVLLDHVGRRIEEDDGVRAARSAPAPTASASTPSAAADQDQASLLAGHRIRPHAGQALEPKPLTSSSMRRSLSGSLAERARAHRPRRRSPCRARRAPYRRAPAAASLRRRSRPSFSLSASRSTMPRIMSPRSLLGPCLRPRRRRPRSGPARSRGRLRRAARRVRRASASRTDRSPGRVRRAPRPACARQIVGGLAVVAVLLGGQAEEKARLDVRRVERERALEGRLRLRRDDAVAAAASASPRSASRSAVSPSSASSLAPRLDGIVETAEPQIDRRHHLPAARRRPDCAARCASTCATSAVDRASACDAARRRARAARPAIPASRARDRARRRQAAAAAAPQARSHGAARAGRRRSRACGNGCIGSGDQPARHFDFARPPPPPRRSGRRHGRARSRRVDRDRRQRRCRRAAAARRPSGHSTAKIAAAVINAKMSQSVIGP